MHAKFQPPSFKTVACTIHGKFKSGLWYLFWSITGYFWVSPPGRSFIQNSLCAIVRGLCGPSRGPCGPAGRTVSLRKRGPSAPNPGTIVQINRVACPLLFIFSLNHIYFIYLYIYIYIYIYLLYIHIYTFYLLLLLFFSFFSFRLSFMLYF